MSANHESLKPTPAFLKFSKNPTIYSCERMKKHNSQTFNQKSCRALYQTLLFIEKEQIEPKYILFPTEDSEELYKRLDKIEQSKIKEFLRNRRIKSADMTDKETLFSMVQGSLGFTGQLVYEICELGITQEMDTSFLDKEQTKQMVTLMEKMIKIYMKEKKIHE